MTNTILRLGLLFSIFFNHTLAQFSLNISGPDWDYTAKDLAITTSQACKDAYSATIDCDPVLLGLVASMRPAFDPTASDIKNTCTPGCTASLAAYVQGVQEACTAPGDASQESQGASDYTDYILDPVALVGQVFQYTLATTCRQASNGSYCYFGGQDAWADDFSCDNECAIQFYEIAYAIPASAYRFLGYWLVSRGSWWEDYFASGYTRVQECGMDTGYGSPSSEGSSASTIALDQSSPSPTIITSAAATSMTSSSSVETTSSSTFKITHSSSPTVSLGLTSTSTSTSSLTSTSSSPAATLAPNSGMVLRVKEVVSLAAFSLLFTFFLI